jgi:hypothetical protein
MSCLVILLAGTIDAHAQSWKKHRYVTDGFEIEFSGEVKGTPTPLNPETQKKVVRAMQYMQDGGDYVYAVAFSLNKEGVNFEEGPKASFAALKCKTTIGDTPLPLPGGRGREIRGVDCHDGTMRAECRYYTTGKWFYQVITLFKKDGGDEKAARYFLQSFKTIKK